MPALPGNTYRTVHGYQFRIVVPEALRPLVGKCEIKKALGRDYHKAVSEARRLALQVDREFAELRTRIKEQQEIQAGLEAFLAQPC